MGRCAGPGAACAASPAATPGTPAATTRPESRPGRPALPELPEVETVVRDLRPHLKGRRIRSVRAGERRLRHGWSSEWEARLAGRRVVGVRRRGKWILLDLD